MFKALWKEAKAPWALLSLSLHLYAAWLSEGFYFWDEHYQVLEFANALLGRAPFGDLAWEYHHQIRPWLQPVLYAIPMWTLDSIGIHDPHFFAFAFRLGTGLFSWVALVGLIVWVRKWKLHPDLERGVVAMTAVAWLLPYLDVRTSSETLSGALMVLGAVSLFGFERFFWAGVLFGLAFSARFQSAFFVFGILSWIFCFQKNTRWKTLGQITLGGAIASALCIALDSACYGHFVITSWNYFESNILKGVSKIFGEKPFWFYFIFTGRTFPPFGLLVWFGTCLFLWRYRRHPLAWGAGLFILGHHLPAHKELRFLFPLAPLVPLMTVLGFGLKIPQKPSMARTLGVLSLSIPQVIASLILCATWTFPLELPLLRTITLSGQQWELWSFGRSDHPHGIKFDFIQGIKTHFYNPTHVHERVIDSNQKWEAWIAEVPRKPFWYIGSLPKAIEDRCRLVQSVWPEWFQKLPFWVYWLNPFGNSRLYACDEKNL